MIVQGDKKTDIETSKPDGVFYAESNGDQLPAMDSFCKIFISAAEVVDKDGDLLDELIDKYFIKL